MKKIHITTTKPDCQTEVEIFRTPPVVEKSQRSQSLQK